MSLLRVIKGRIARKKSAPGPRSVTGSVDAGRSAFVELHSKESKLKRSLLRKINLYWSQKKTASRQSFRKDGGISWRRMILLFICLTVSVGLFINRDGLGNTRSLIAGLDYFHITSITVNGCVHASPDRVRSSSGILKSTSLLFLDDKVIAEKITSQNKWVHKVEIVRRWPDEAVVHVTEFVPVALIGSKGDGGHDLFYMDKAGTPFIRTVPGMDLDLPVVTGVEEMSAAERRETMEEALDFLLLIRKNNPNLPSQSVSEIHIEPNDGLVVYMAEYPFPIFFGSGDVAKKYYKLRKVLEKLYKYKPSKNNLGIADVSYIRMDYSNNKVLVGYSRNIES